MKVICLFAQMKERYPGEYAPDLRGAIDENGADENPAYLDDLEGQLREDNSIAFTRRIVLEIDDKDFDRVFYGEEIKAKVSTDE